jgi:hypothetical protein
MCPKGHNRADDGIRTRDPHLGKVMRYQLRYVRAPEASFCLSSVRHDVTWVTAMTASPRGETAAGSALAEGI